MKRPVFSRIYFPGLISLVLLPLMCYGYFAYQAGLSKMSGMDVAFADVDFFERVKFDVKNFEARSTKFEISGDAKNNSATLSKLKILCNDIIRKNKYGEGVMVTIKDDADYQDFVNLMDVGLSTKVSFTAYQNKVFYTLFKPVKTEWGRVPHPIHDYFEIVYNRSELPLLATISRFWPSAIAFLLMIFFAIRSKRRRLAADI
nr:hypothetical protein [uncultured Mucilaginibacter sp.]